MQKQQPRGNHGGGRSRVRSPGELDGIMPIRKMRKLLQIYTHALKERGAEPERLKDMSQPLPVENEPVFDHCLWMISEIERELDTKADTQLTQAHRWFGVLQGFMIARGVMTIQDCQTQAKTLTDNLFVPTTPPKKVAS